MTHHNTDRYHGLKVAPFMNKKEATVFTVFLITEKKETPMKKRRGKQERFYFVM